MRGFVFRCALVFAALAVMLQAHVESSRWWWSPDVIRALDLTPEQSRELDRAYDSTLPVRCHLAEQITALANRVQRLNATEASDNEVMPATERLAHAQAERAQLSTELIARADRVLSPAQRPIFRRLLARHRINAD